MSKQLKTKLNRWLNIIQFTLFPPLCVLCNKQGQEFLDLCKECEVRLGKIPNPCINCALPLPAGYSGKVCGKCLLGSSPFSETVSACPHNSSAARLLNDLKFHGRLTNARVMAAIMLRRIENHYRQRQLPTHIITVPLHISRLRSRGFNQSIELARFLCKSLDCSLHRNLVRRVHPGPDQKTLDARQRRMLNGRQFRIDNKKVESLEGPMAILDDVITTGSTCRVIAGLIRQNTDQEIHLWSFSRAIQWHQAGITAFQ